MKKPVITALLALDSVMHSTLSRHNDDILGLWIYITLASVAIIAAILGISVALGG